MIWIFVVLPGFLAAGAIVTAYLGIKEIKRRKNLK